jgi:hypothetical protein
MRKQQHPIPYQTIALCAVVLVIVVFAGLQGQRPEEISLGPAGIKYETRNQAIKDCGAVGVLDQGQGTIMDNVTVIGRGCGIITQGEGSHYNNPTVVNK